MFAFGNHRVSCFAVSVLGCPLLCLLICVEILRYLIINTETKEAVACHDSSCGGQCETCGQKDMSVVPQLAIPDGLP